MNPDRGRARRDEDEEKKELVDRLREPPRLKIDGPELRRLEVRPFPEGRLVIAYERGELLRPSNQPIFIH